MSRSRTTAITIGLMTSLLLASLESTIIATAMPTIIADLGGLEHYSWVFAAYMVASTVTVPLFGKMADRVGRRPTFALAMVLFLIGSLLCGTAATMPALVFARIVQGLGAGGLLPLVFTIIGDSFSLEQRARMQGVFSSVWGVSSIVGPLLGGFFVDQLSWHWIFYVNIPPGIIAAAIIWWSYRDQPRSTLQPPIDLAGALLLSSSIVLILLGLFELGEPAGLPLLGGAVLSAIALVWVERRAVDPVFPLRLFGQRTFAAACGQGLAAGFAMFGCISFVPLYARAVLGSDATGAGIVLMPMMLGWVFSAIVAGRLMLRFAFRTLAIGGMLLLVLGSAVLALSGAGVPQALLIAALTCMGIGMGQAIPSFLIAVQSSVARSDMGSATSAIQFTRSIGGALGVSVMGVALAAQLERLLRERGIDPGSIDLDAALEPAAAGVAASGALIGEAITIVFVITWIAAVLALLATLAAPGGRVGALRRPEAPPAEVGP